MIISDWSRSVGCCDVCSFVMLIMDAISDDTYSSIGIVTALFNLQSTRAIFSLWVCSTWSRRGL